MKKKIAAAFMAAPLLCATLAACGGSDDSSSAGANSSAEDKKDAAPAALTCGSFEDALAKIDPAAKFSFPTAKFYTGVGPDCRVDGETLGDAIDLDMDDDEPYGAEHMQPSADGKWDYEDVGGSGTYNGFFKKVREGEWFECAFQDAYGGNDGNDTLLTPSEVDSLIQFCSDALEVAQAGAPQREGW